MTATTNKLGITPGEWFVRGDIHPVCSGDNDMGRMEEWCGQVVPEYAGKYRGPIAEFQSSCCIRGIGLKECEANARLTAEAGTVANETGLTPRQLLDQRDKLVKAAQIVLSRVADVASEGGSLQDLFNRGSCRELVDAIQHTKGKE